MSRDGRPFWVDQNSLALYELSPRCVGITVRYPALGAGTSQCKRKGSQMVCKLLRRAALAAVVFSFAGLARADLGMAQSVSVMSQPSESRKLSFPQAGILKETLGKDGDK